MLDPGFLRCSGGTGIPTLSGMSGSRLAVPWFRGDRASPPRPRRTRVLVRQFDGASTLDFHFTPTSGWWLNAVESFFSTRMRKHTRRGGSQSIVDLRAAINRSSPNTTPPQTPSSGQPAPPQPWPSSAGSVKVGALATRGRSPKKCQPSEERVVRFEHHDATNTNTTTGGTRMA